MTNLSTTLGTVAAAAGLALAASACASTTTARADCFSSTQWRGWSSPQDDVLYLRVGGRDVWQVDLSPGSGRNLDRGGRFIISEVRGSSRICTANDLDISIADSAGFRTPLFPRTLRRLTPEEAAALPAGSRP